MRAILAEPFDLLVVGGGINGAGIARDAAGRGLSVLLVEQGDLAQATSSASSKLIHGGLRYLEQFEFRLVREALGEREVLLRAAPHIIWPLRFVLPHDARLRPAWMLRLGLWLYDHLGRREVLPGSEALNLPTVPEGRALQPSFRRGFAYSDCWVDDARLVVLAARDAADRGARISTRTRLIAARRDGPLWMATLANDGNTKTVAARVLVNAAGPWVGQVLALAVGSNAPAPLRLVKGSHIVVPRLWDGPHAYILQAPDRRVVFAIPYENAFTLIGTTDQPFTGDPTGASIDADEIAYLCAAASRYLAQPVTPADVVWSYSGVRPLYDDHAASAARVTRDYVLKRDGSPPLLSVFGGKITTFRELAEHALRLLRADFPAMGGDWTATANLPGGDIAGADFAGFLAELAARYPGQPLALLRRLARAYGTIADQLLAGGLGPAIVGDLHEAELRHMMAEEWAQTAEDVLWRRSKLGLHLTAAEQARLAAVLSTR